ncbi:MAG: glycosyltransferase family 2 protein [Desulfosalsimonadaceae bacterium]
MLRFAVVVPNLNQSRFLAMALESIRHQSVPVSLAVMDGGSTDDFEKVAARYRDMIDHVRSGPDGGQAAAIKKGKEIAEGDIVCWLNADDYYFPGALDKVSAVFETHPEIDVVYGDAVHVTPMGEFLSYFPAAAEYNARLLPVSCFICQPACFVRRTAYDKVGGIDPALKYTMDWDLWCRLGACGAKFTYLHAPLAAVRCYPETKTLSGDRRRYWEIWRIGKKYGNRWLPVSWLGFYRYDLSFKQNRTPEEKWVFNGLEWARQVKKKLFKETHETLYGFYRWTSTVDGQCLIQLPWYGDRKSKELILAVSPENACYRIAVNNMGAAVHQADNGRVTMAMPEIVPEACLQVRMSCSQGRRWELRSVSFLEI